MPILVAAQPSAPPVQVAPSLDTQPWAFVDATGRAWPLTRRELGYWILRNTVTGLGITPWEETRDDRARGGTSTRNEWIDGRLITFEMFVSGATRLEMLDRWRALGRALRRGGLLRIAQADGTVREIAAKLEPGAYDNHPERGPRHEQPTVQLWCPDGYFRDADPVLVTSTVAAASTRRFLSPFLSVTSARIPGRATLVNDGDVPAWPDWELIGPLSGFTAINHTLGASFSIDPTWDAGPPLGAGDTVAVTSDPPTVTGPAGQVWWGAINGDLWPLNPGANDVEYLLSGKEAGSGVRLSYRRRYDTV